VWVDDFFLFLESKSLFQKKKKNMNAGLLRETAYMTLLGGWCADAVGARLEFRKSKFSLQEVNDAMHFTGEKTNGIPEGQFTDDSEMEIAMLHALVKAQDAVYFPAEEIAQEYIEWIKSNPFDVGVTTRYALANASSANDMTNNAIRFNARSESNGSLMRCVPIAVLCYNRSVETIMTVAAEDAELTHCSPIVQEVAGLYCSVLASILRSHVTKQPLPSPSSMVSLLRKHATERTIQSWIDEGVRLKTLDQYDAITQEGHVKHAFVLVVFFLKQLDRCSYENTLASVLMCGGDTDTNAKIVANLVSAYHQFVPDYISSVVLKRDSTKSPRPYTRPPKYSIQHAINLIERINNR
jgi:ADP-ribosyl-[dinitrogen reductase] hydrolase